MKAKPGFVLRTIADEYMLMPIDENIGTYKGMVLLNRVSAFIWEQLQAPVSRDGLLSALLEKYDIDEASAAEDLDAVLAQFRQLELLDDPAE